MDAEDAKIIGHRVAQRIEASKEAVVEDEPGMLFACCGSLAWYPVLPGSLSLLIEGVEWNDDGNGALIDGVGTEVGSINYQNGRFALSDDVGLIGPVEYLAKYAYDIREADSRITNQEINLILAGFATPRPGLIRPAV